MTNRAERPAEEPEELTWDELVRDRAAMWVRHRMVGTLTRRRREARRASFPAVRVSHPVYGTVMVHAESKCDAIHQAAQAWGVEFSAASGGAEVWR